MRRLRVLLAALVLAACAFEPAAVERSEVPRPHTIYVFSNGWHTGIVVARDDIPLARIPETADLPGAAFFEFGWGDREYFPAPKPTTGMALTAAFASSGAVVHMAGWPAPPHQFHRIEAIAVPVDAPALDRLAQAIGASFDRGTGARAQIAGPGLQTESFFYPARGRFHVFNTCNTWTASTLAAAGIPVPPTGVITAGDLMGHLRAIPRVQLLSAPD
ncbi:MAG: DUF2459 domain-containing protein [Rhodospirillales bacterium]|nr:DUF2459 domain-containing protein [Rhodospirillales bacterium]